MLVAFRIQLSVRFGLYGYKKLTQNDRIPMREKAPTGAFLLQISDYISIHCITECSGVPPTIMSRISQIHGCLEVV